MYCIALSAASEVGEDTEDAEEANLNLTSVWL